MALFDTPEQVQAQQQAARVAQGNASVNPANGALFNAGFAGANAISRGFGADTRTKPEKKAENIQKLIKGLDLTNRKSVQSVANKLQQAGHMAEAQQLISIAPAGTFGAVTTETLTLPSGETSKQRFQTGPDGKTESVGAPLKSNAPSSGGSDTKLDMARWNDFGIPDNLKPFVTKNFTDQINVGEWFDGPPEQEDLDPIIGKVQVFAARLKRDHFNDLKRNSRAAAKQAGVGINEANTWLNEQSIDDSIFTQQAINEIKASGGMEGFAQFNAVMDDKINVDTNEDITPAEAKVKAARITQNKGFLAEHEKLVDGIVFGKIDSGELNLKGVNLEKGLRAFQNFDVDSEEEIADNFRDQGIDVGSGEAFASHVDNWGWMKDAPTFTKAWMSADSKIERGNLMSDTAVLLIEQNRLQDLWTITRIHNYLSRMKLAGPTGVSKSGALTTRQRN